MWGGLNGRMGKGKSRRMKRTLRDEDVKQIRGTERNVSSFPESQLSQITRQTLRHRGPVLSWPRNKYIILKYFSRGLENYFKFLGLCNINFHSLLSAQKCTKCWASCIFVRFSLTMWFWMVKRWIIVQLLAYLCLLILARMNMVL